MLRGSLPAAAPKGSWRDWFAQLYDVSLRGHFKSAELVCLHGAPGSNKKPVLARLERMGFPTVTTSWVASCLAWVTKHPPDPTRPHSLPLLDGAARSQVLQDWTTAWLQELERAMAKSPRRPVFALRNPVLLDPTPPVPAPLQHLFGTPRVANILCVSDPILMKERLAYRWELLESQPLERAIREELDDFALLHDDQAPNPGLPASVVAEMTTLYTGDAKMAVAALLEFVGEAPPVFQLPSSRSA